ncbi:MAG TPA: DUF3126 family protein [Thermoanaerobaculia bacterium]|nr:DUF3126 family protein [Thermoanaerobaculia bacterium]
MDQKDLDRVQAHLKRTFGNPHFKIGSRIAGVAQVEVKGQVVGFLTPDEDEDGSYQFEARLELPGAKLDAAGVARIQAHLQQLFGSPAIKVIARPRQKDSAEVELNGEFIAVVYEDDDEDGNYLFEMAILPEDLEA